jgi:hypothetical protein
MNVHIGEDEDEYFSFYWDRKRHTEYLRRMKRAFTIILIGVMLVLFVGISSARRSANEPKKVSPMQHNQIIRELKEYVKDSHPELTDEQRESIFEGIKYNF